MRREDNMPVAVLIVLGLLGRFRRRSQPAAQHSEVEGAREGPALDATPTSSRPGHAQPAFLVGIAEAVVSSRGLTVQWNGIVVGDQTVWVEWTSPTASIEGGTLHLRYVRRPGLAGAGHTRPCAPGEVVSRRVTLPAGATAGAAAGTSIVLEVGYSLALDADASGTATLLAVSQAKQIAAEHTV
jgi:hypothetical protein